MKVNQAHVHGRLVMFLGTEKQHTKNLPRLQKHDMCLRTPGDSHDCPRHLFISL